MGGGTRAVSGAIIGGKKDRGEVALHWRRRWCATGNLLGRSKDRADEQRAAVGSAVTATQTNKRPRWRFRTTIW